MAEYQILQRQHQQMQQKAQEMEQQRLQFLAEQQRREAEVHISNADQEQFEHGDFAGPFEPGPYALVVYQNNPSNAVPSITTNPFDDNFSTGNSQSDELDRKTALNPFESVFTAGVAEAGPTVKDRSSTSKSHFRSRSDTFSDLARRAGDDGSAYSHQLLSVNEAGSPHKSSPDIRMEQDVPSGKEKGVNINGHSIVVGKIDMQGFKDLYRKQGENSEDSPKLLLDIGKPVIENKFSITLAESNREPAVLARRTEAKVDSCAKPSDSKDEKPTLEEADESPLISPSSSSVQERRYIYVRTSSCSSDEVSEKSIQDNSSEDEVDFPDDRVDYDGIGSSSSSIEADLENCGLKETEETVGDEDIFGSAPFHVGTKKQTYSKRTVPPFDSQQKDKQTSRSKDTGSEPSIQAAVTSSSGLGGSAETENLPSNPFGMDPFTVAVKSEPLKCKGTTSNSAELKVNENTLSRSPTSEDPFGHAPFVKIVKQKRPLSSQELAKKNEGERMSHPRVHPRRRVLPRTPIQE